MKADEYNVRIVFGNDKKPSRFYSYCDCPDGLHFCSHMLALMLLLKVLQIQPEWNLATLTRMLPEPIKTIQSLPIAVDYVYRVLADRDKSVKEMTAEMGKRWKARSENGGTGIFCRALSAEHGGYTASEDTDDQAVESASLGEPDPYTPSNVSEWIHEHSLKHFCGLGDRIRSTEALCRMSPSSVSEMVRTYGMNRKDELLFRNAIKSVQRLNLCDACNEFVQSALARSTICSTQGGAGPGSLVGSSAVNT